MNRVAQTWIAIALFGLLGLTSLQAQAQDRLSLYVDPACPKPNEEIMLWATIGAGYSYLAQDPVEVSIHDNNTVRFVVLRFDNERDNDDDGYWPTVYSAHSVVAKIGPLPVGSYQVQLHVRRHLSDTQFVPALLESIADFTVQENPPACAARHIVGKVSQMLTAELGQPYSSPFVVEVTDAHGLPVADARVFLERLEPSEPCVYSPDKQPDVVVSGVPSMIAPGTYVFPARANDVPGTFQYRAFLADVPFQPSAYFVVSNRPGAVTFPLIPVVEYYNAYSRHYFMTTSFDEMAKLDKRSEWYRTRGVFLAYAAGTAARPIDASPVCRFYGRPDAGLDSHFFSASAEECEAVRKQLGGAWLLETDNAFGVLLPDAQTGACPADTQPIYRAYNNRPDANHRYTADPSALNVWEYPTGPWVREGYGPEAVAMCAPE